MAEPAELTPGELDRLEDALEDLAIDHADDRLEGTSPLVRQRLADYRRIVLATRDALPLEMPRAGLLDAVLAEARAGGPEVVAVTSSAPAPESWWKRMRRSFLIPSLALAGSAALVLLMVQPRGGEAPSASDGVARSDEPARASSKAEAKADFGAEIGDGRDAAVTESRTTVPDAAPKAGPVPATLPPPAAGAPAAADEASGSDLRQNPGGMTQLAEPESDEEKRAEEAKPVAKEKPAVAGNSADFPPGQDLIQRADQARRAGDCRSAREDYLLASEDDDANVRARAYAGLGLCDAAAGNSDSAEDNYARARDIDPSVGSLIDKEASRAYRGGAAKPAPSKKASKPKSVESPQQPANDPFPAPQ